MNIVETLRNKAKENVRTVVLPEAFDDRTLIACAEIVKHGLAKPILLGNPETVNQQAHKLGVELGDTQIIDPATYEKNAEFADYLYEKRKKRGMTMEVAVETVKDPLYSGALMVKFGIAHCMVAGAASTTADVLRAALHVVGVAAGLKTVSSSFIMVVPDYMGEDRIYLFADCAVVPNPDAAQLADIAMSTALTRKKLLGDDPKVALLSFATKGSAQHELVDKVLETKAILDERKVDFEYDGELQLDAAVVPKIGEKKAPGSKVAGNANVLIFPDLQAGNIGYKLVQRFAKAEAIGPVIQGLAAPICDLSRGCSAEDIVNTSVLASLMSI